MSYEEEDTCHMKQRPGLTALWLPLDSLFVLSLTFANLCVALRCSCARTSGLGLEV